MVLVENPHLDNLQEDVLYHFGLTTKQNLKDKFGDVKFVCCGGSAGRMLKLAKYLQSELGIQENNNGPLNLSSNSDRYSIYKVGPILCINHGIGMASLSVMLHETLKLLHHSQCLDVTLIRIGTSGGIGIEPGTVIVSEEGLNGLLQPYYVQYILGKEVKAYGTLDRELAQSLLKHSDKVNFPVVSAKTIGVDDFYEAQGRLDGAFCSFSENDKFDFLHKIYDAGVRNMEMEAPLFSAICKRAGIKGAIVCVTLLNRLNGDQVTSSKEKLKDFESRPIQLVTAYIKNTLTTIE